MGPALPIRSAVRWRNEEGSLPEIRVRDIAGTVVDEEGRPLGGATVVCVADYRQQPWAGTPTRADGAFSFRVPAAGEWVLAAGKEGRTGDLRVLATDARPGPIRLVCRKGETALDVRYVTMELGASNMRIRLPGSGSSCAGRARCDGSPPGGTGAAVLTWACPQAG